MSSTTTPLLVSPLLPSPLATESSTEDSRRNTAINSRAWADIRRRRWRSGKKRSARAREEVSKKLEALKDLIPSTRGECRPTEAVAADELFMETADYILRLKAQVVLLQNLIRIYGSPDQVDRDYAACMTMLADS